MRVGHAEAEIGIMKQLDHVVSSKGLNFKSPTLVAVLEVGCSKNGKQ